jgi:hypothetical protein
METKVKVKSEKEHDRQKDKEKENNDPITYRHSTNMLISEQKHRKNMKEIYKQIPKNMKWNYIALIICLTISMVLSGLSLFVAIKTTSLTSKALVTLAFFSLTVFIFGFFAIRLFKNRVKKFLSDYEDKDPEEIDQSKERTFLNIFIYLLMIDCIVFIILGVGSIAFRDQIELEIRAIASDSGEWQQYFGSVSYDIVIKNFRAVLYAFGAISFTLCVVIGFLLVKIFKGLGAYRTWQTIIEFIAVVFFLLGFAFVYLAVYVYAYREVSNVDQAIPSWTGPALLGIAVIAVVIAIIGYVAAFMESLNMLRVFLIMAICYTIVITVLSCFGAAFLTKIDTFIGQRNCLKLLDRVNEKHLEKYAGCKQKYVFIQSDVSGMKCPKDRILSAWEVNLGKSSDEQTTSFGCVDMGCCNQTFAYIKSKLNWLIVITFNLISAGILLIIGTFFMIKKLKEGLEQGVADKKVRWVLLGFIIITVSIFAIFLGLSPDVPVPDPVMVVDVDRAERINTMVDNNIVTSSSNNITTIVEQNAQERIISGGLYDVKVSEDSSKCNGGVCDLSMLYTYQVSSDDGYFANIMKREGDSISIVKDDEYGVIFQGDIKAIQAGFMVIFDYQAKCPLAASWVNLNITGNATRIIRTLQEINFDEGFEDEGFKMLQEVTNNVDTTATTTSNASTTTSTDTSTGAVNAGNDSTNPTSTPEIKVDMSAVNVGGTYTYYNGRKDFSYLTSDTQIITGRVLFISNNLERIPCDGCTVNIHSIEFPLCQPQRYYTDTHGYWKSDNYNITINNTAVRYTVAIKYQNYVTYSKTITLGGIGWVPEVDLGNMELFSSVASNEKAISPLKFQTVVNTITFPITSDISRVITTDQSVSLNNTVVETNGMDSDVSFTSGHETSQSGYLTQVSSTANIDLNTNTDNSNAGSNTGGSNTNVNSGASTGESTSTTDTTGTNTGASTTDTTSSNASTTTNPNSSTNTNTNTNTDNTSINLPSLNTTLPVTNEELINAGVNNQTSILIQSGTTLIPVIIPSGELAAITPVEVQEPVVVVNNQVAAETTVSTGASSVTITQTQTLVLMDDSTTNVNSFSASAAIANEAVANSVNTSANTNNAQATSSGATITGSTSVVDNTSPTSGTSSSTTIDNTNPTSGTSSSTTITTTTDSNSAGTTAGSISTSGTGSTTTDSSSSTGTTAGNTSTSGTGTSTTDNTSSTGTTTGNTNTSGTGTSTTDNTGSTGTTSGTTGTTSNSSTSSTSSQSASAITSTNSTVSAVPPTIATTTNDLPIRSSSESPSDAINRIQTIDAPNAVMTSIVLSSLTNKPLLGVNVYLFKGNIKLDNNEVTPMNITLNTTDDNIILNRPLTITTDLSKDPTLVATAVSDQFGNFGFGNLAPNKYTVILELAGYYRETVCK